MSVNKQLCKPAACELNLLILDDLAWPSSCAPTSLNQILRMRVSILRPVPVLCSGDASLRVLKKKKKKEKKKAGGKGVRR